MDWRASRAASSLCEAAEKRESELSRALALESLAAGSHALIKVSAKPRRATRVAVTLRGSSGRLALARGLSTIGDREELAANGFVLAQRPRPSPASRFRTVRRARSMSPARRDWHSRSQGSCRNRRHRACCRADARTQMLLIVGLMLQGLAAEPFSSPSLTTPMSLSPSALRPVATLAMLPSELLSRARAGRPTAQGRLRYRRD